MKEINHGLQYKVYSYNKNQNLKKPTSLSFKLKILNLWQPEMSYSEKRKFAEGSEKIMIKSIKFFKKNKKNINMSLIGNPVFLKKKVTFKTKF